MSGENRKIIVTDRANRQKDDFYPAPEWVTRVLLGFPDGWTEYGADGRKMSDSARYKALGNAVTVNFPRMIGEKLR